MATWDEVRMFFAPRSAEVACVAGPALEQEAGELVLRSLDPVLGLAWSADGRRLAVASGGRIVGADGTVQVAEPATGRTLLLRGHGRGTHAVAFDPRTGWLASAGHDGAVGLWDLEAGRGFPIRGARPRECVAFAGSLLLIGDELPPPGGSSRFTVLDLSAPRVILDEALPEDFLVAAFALDPAAGRIAVLLFHAGGNQRFEIRTFPSWEVVWSADFSGEAYVNGLAWPEEGVLLLSESDSRRVRRLLRLDAATGEVLQDRIIGETMVGATAVDVGRGRIATAGNDRVLGLWRLSDLEPLDAIPLGKWPVASIALSPDGRQVAIGSASEGGVRILSLP